MDHLPYPKILRLPDPSLTSQWRLGRDAFRALDADAEAALRAAIEALA